MKTVSQLMSLEGRVALVTGAAGHVGAAICEALAEQGASLAALDFAGPACREMEKRLHDKLGAKAVSLDVDLGDERAVRDVPERVLASLKRLDIVVNCAAMVGTSSLTGWAVPFERQSSQAWRQALEINLTAPFVLTQACAEALAATGGGCVVNIGSIYGVVAPTPSLYEGTGMESPAAYAASKGGLMQLTRWLASYLAPSIRVNALSLGGIERGQPETFRRRYCDRTPLGRMATEEDFKGAVAFLASDMSSYMTGQNIVIDGGWTII